MKCADGKDRPPSEAYAFAKGVETRQAGADGWRDHMCPYWKANLIQAWKEGWNHAAAPAAPAAETKEGHTP